MFKYSAMFSSFSVKDIKRAKEFYSGILDLPIKDSAMGVLELEVPKANNIIIYPKPDHQPAVFTVLNIPVENIDKAVDHLAKKGIRFEQYDGEIATDEKGICRSKGEEPTLAWFKDPEGNIISVLEE